MGCGHCRPEGHSPAHARVFPVYRSQDSAQPGSKGLLEQDLSLKLTTLPSHSIWKPLRGPLNDWPLALCDASTVNANQDLEAADLLYTDFATENRQVYYRDEYKWYYLSDHGVDELLVFKQSDTDADACPGMYTPALGRKIVTTWWTCKPCLLHGG
jgi:hypothetical protein